MNLDKLKEAARKYEQREEWRRAIEVYLQAIREAEEAGEGTQDPALYNRVGDLEIKAGDNLAALRAYEQAAELYADQGFFNNAIALCGKILRVNPSRTATYLRLAQLHARKNFVGEAKKNLIEYLERMSGVGQLEEAFTALKQFADHFSSNPDIRLMLVELLRASSRNEEAKEQLEKLAAELEARGDTRGARRTRERLSAIGEETKAPARPDRSPHDLVFLDTGVSGKSEPVERVEGLMSAGAENLAPSADPLVRESGEHGASSLDAGAAAGEALGIQDSSFEGSDVIWLDDEAAPVEKLDDLINADAAGPEQGAPEGELAMLDVEEGALDLGSGVEHGLPMTWLPEEGPEAAALQGDALDDLAATEFDDVESPPASEPPPEVARGPADLMMLQLADSVGSDLGVEPSADLMDRARALLDAGDRAGGIKALEEALLSLETEARWEEALSVCADLIRVDPDSIHRYQKQVELAYRAGRREALVGAYLELGDALVRAGATDHASHVYRRVLEHDPGNDAAQTSLVLLEGAPPTPEAPPPSAPSVSDRQSGTPPPASASPSQFVDLGALILDEQGPRDTRMRVDQKAPIEDEDQAFLEALADFKRGIEANLDAEDFQAHYDLGIAFKEMGLIDEAIAQFQKALRSPEGRLKTSEQLGVAFFEKGQFGIAEAVLRRAVESLAGGEDQKIGLFYWLGRALEAQQRGPEARPLYERALAVDIRFLDLDQRVARLAAEAGS